MRSGNETVRHSTRRLVPTERLGSSARAAGNQLAPVGAALRAAIHINMAHYVLTAQRASKP
jgi:hypothetical protein